MDFLLEALGEVAVEVLGRETHLLNLDSGIVFVDTTSTYFQCDVADDHVETAEGVLDDDEVSSPVEGARRVFGHSKDPRGDLPQVVIAMAVTRDGVPVACWTFDGDSTDTKIIRTVKDNLGACGLRRLMWVADRGFASQTNRPTSRGVGGHHIHAKKLRHTNTEATAALARAGRYHQVGGNLRVKEVHAAPGGTGDGDGGVRTERFVVCHNPDQADRDAAVRTNLVEQLEALIEGSDPWTPRVGTISWGR